MSHHRDVEIDSERLSWWHLSYLFFGGFIVAALPFLLAIRTPRGLDKFLFSVGASSLGFVILAMAFPELRTPPNPRFSFDSKLRVALCAISSLLVFLGIALLASYCRARGWWR